VLFRSLESLGFPNNVAVFYPLQSFSNLSISSIPKIPILIEAQDEVFCSRLISFATHYFNQVSKMNSEQRKHLHLAAVIANNFTNHLIHLTEKYCAEHQLDFNLLKPLIVETAKKWMSTSAGKIQTGPAIRGDFGIIEQHKNSLTNNMKRIYELLSESIINTHNIK